MGRRAWWRRVRINPLFLGFVAVYWAAGQGRAALIAFVAVTLHELSHAVIAELYGLDVVRIEIWPFGGIAEIHGLEAEEPYVEAMVAVAGPLMNFFWAAVAWAFIGALPLNPHAASQFIAANLGIGAVNLLPVAPLDGGRLARLYLARSIGYGGAEKWVREGGLWLARGIFALTLVTAAFGGIHVSLAIFAVFLYWGAFKAGRQAPYLAVRDLAQRLGAFHQRTVWAVDDFAARAEVPLGEVIRILRPLRYHRVVVLDAEMKRVGVLYEAALLQGLSQKGPDCPLGDLLHLD